MASGLSPSTTNTTTNRLPFGMGGYASAPRGGLVSSRITMKICFFHLMPYRFLPEDFERKYRSVWVDVPHHLFDGEDAGALPGVPERARVRREAGLRRPVRERA